MLFQCASTSTLICRAQLIECVEALNEKLFAAVSANGCRQHVCQASLQLNNFLRRAIRSSGNAEKVKGERTGQGKI